MSNKSFTVPITREYSKTPVTPMQKLVAEDRLKLRQ